MGRSNKLFLLMPRRNAGKIINLNKNDSDRNPIGKNDFSSTQIIPKHVTLPKFSNENELLTEFQAIILFIASMITQYLNLYPTIWWLEQSNTNTALNFHLIDINAVVLSTLFITRPFMLHLANMLTNYIPTIFRQFYVYLSLTVIHFIWTLGQIRCATYIFLNHGVAGVLCIIYPMIIYLLMFSSNLIQAYENTKSLSTSFNTFKYCFIKSMKILLLPDKYSSQSPIHQCTIIPEMIRDEVDKLKSSFNDRLKQILFRSLLIAYYSSFIPLYFTQNFVIYDHFWTAQHVCIVWLSAFLMLTSHLYSPQFYDILHKSSLHLGKWNKLETRNPLIPCNSWSDKVLYSPGVVVRHYKEYYKSEGLVNSAEPGNPSHLRYYIVFSNPVGGFGTLLGLLVVLVVVQIILLIKSHEWNRLISMSLLIVVNSLTVFRLVRSCYVLKKVYTIESTLQEINQQNLKY